MLIQKLNLATLIPFVHKRPTFIHQHSCKIIRGRYFCPIINSRNEKLLETEMNKKLSYVLNWCCANKLSLYPKKSNYIVISPKSNVKLFQISLTMNDTTIYPNIDVKYLSVLIDTQLNFLSHIKFIEQKDSRSSGIILKLRSFLQSSALLNLYYFLLHPQLLYGLKLLNISKKRLYSTK